MKNFVLVAMLGALCFFSCKKDDPCETLACLNGGTCVSGVCDCPPGFTGANCEINTDPCQTITCLHGGECVNGECICSEMWTGPDCSLQVTPRSITIVAVTLKEHASRNPDGELWDVGGLPDPILTISQNGTTVYNGGFFSDIMDSEDVTWRPDLKISNLNDPVRFLLEDNDTFVNDLMSRRDISLYNSSNGFPILIESTATGSENKYDIFISYDW